MSNSVNLFEFIGVANGGTVPKKFEVEDGLWIRPQYFEKYSVVGCVQKYELNKKKMLSRKFFL